MYKLLKPFIFQFAPETAHHIAVGLLSFACKVPFVKSIFSSMFSYNKSNLEKEVLGLTFKHPVGLAAGFDKNANLFNSLTTLGFSFIEVGTVTPKAQPGNPTPRSFRLPKDNALINRMGFNNNGVDEMVKHLKKAKRNGVVIGGNIGKNKVTPNENAISDYVTCFNALFDYVDYFAVNVSSPNTPNLRELQGKEPLLNLLKTLEQINQEKPNPKPILLKIAPDVSNFQLQEIIDIINQLEIAGVIATNTTISRENLKTEATVLEGIGGGGLSGQPVTERSTEVIQLLRKGLSKEKVIIGVGGIYNAQTAQEKLNAGADLVQVYTGLIYEGPMLVKNICETIHY